MDVEAKLKFTLEVFALLAILQGLLVWLFKPHLRLWIRKSIRAKDIEDSIKAHDDQLVALQQMFELRGARIKEMEDELQQLPSVAESLSRVSKAMEDLAKDHKNIVESVIRVEEGQRWIIRSIEDRRSNEDRRQNHD